MYKNKPPQCKNPDEVDRKDIIQKSERTSSGAWVRMSHFPDGSIIVHWGGPVGDSYYDSDGEEC